MGQDRNPKDPVITYVPKNCGTPHATRRRPNSGLPDSPPSQRICPAGAPNRYGGDSMRAEPLPDRLMREAVKVQKPKKITMLVCAEMRPLNHDEYVYRRKILRDSVICIGWLKLISVICCVGLLILVHANSSGKWSIGIQAMIAVLIPLQIVHGLVLFMGTIEEKVLAIEIGLWLCLIIATYNTLLGTIGFVFFIRTGYLTMHFLIAIVFGILALSLFTVLCHDILIIYAFKEFLRTSNDTS
ncbi:hypothetical protein K1T71_008140 [Dendrolimus kikuchii]|uniref:Uncharacterized protein n=1 Tax=Dendrolimus kikuchii TaxID=765133 RepID=A0ACC1CW68_9NEOP|nr:hypothetical protein K1T71_008140 [Dendrolimus kikuchii]